MKTKYEFKKAVKLYLLEGTKIKVLFSDGKTILFDMENVFKRLPEYRALKDRNLFLKAKLDGWGGIKWTPSLDLSVDTVYYEGKEIKSEENASMLILGFTIKEKRLEKNLTQKQLSECTGSDQADISRLEQGLYNPSFKFLENISKALGKKLTISLN